MGDFNHALQLKYEQQCPDCGQSDFVEDHASGDLVCRNCGVVVEAHVIDERSEWRTFADKVHSGGSDPNRVGGPVNHLLSDGGMSTMIGGGKGVDHALVREAGGCWPAGDGVTTDRAVIAAFREIGKICAAMKLLDTVKKQAEEFYKQAYDNAKSIKGKSQAAVLAAIVFLACRHTGNPRTFKEICAVVPQASVKEIGRIYKSVVRELKLEEALGNKQLEGSHPHSYMRRFMSQLSMTPKEYLWGEALALALLPQSPTSIAGTVVYIIANLPGKTSVPLQDICRTCGVADGTIRQIYREIHPHLKALIDKAGRFASHADVERLPQPIESTSRPF
ncbi:hypothetical protein CHLNCDRAFT_24273 [Chlorella variabilis]|uniref:General transcription factor TFIIB n=1 Tax=Chlorella variabilis TaxID=554065 RepID=E1ZH39_CHLVA|nr:hypothetical protein CHLNCDRAFT_24273 [Chlorella variabilis]EFN54856.1 hypothetical protein CHLNCDRAFT_24273 [Chlorella variabilis]|eukprot:XP_005846958.1 hypothetical protein CHLNCDRAFT_24273 [Chlorella variabilis]